MAAGHSGFDQRLLEAARKCDLLTLEGLVQGGKVNLNAKDKTGCTAVHLCCKAADLASLALLLEHGARADLFDSSGMAPIHHAAVKDYIETMAVLVSYGANINIQNMKTKQTPLHVAAKDRNSRSIKFLLFCGADTQRQDKVGNAAELGLTHHELEKHRALRVAFKNGHVQIFGKMINCLERHTFQSVGVTVANTCAKSKQFSILCRKVEINHVTLDLIENRRMGSYLKDGHKELISDIYEYLVNQVVEEVWITVPVISRGTHFDTLYIIDSTGDKFKAADVKEVDQTIYCTACMVLKAYEDTIYSFAVVMETKSDVYFLDGTAQTLTSSVEDGFKIQLPEKCLPKYTEVAMRVIPTFEYQQNLNTELIERTSHFCEIRINQKNRKPLNITLPVPNGYVERYNRENNTRLTVFHSQEAHEAAEEQQPDWQEIDCVWRPGSGNLTVTDKSINNGTCIVTEIPKKKGSDILGKIKQFINWLYDTAIRRKAYICFFAMTKQCSKDVFRLLVGLCDARAINKNIEKWEKEKYVCEISQRTSIYLASSGASFIAKLNDTGNQVKSSDKIFLKYHRQKTSHQDFIVNGKEHDFLQVDIYKEQNENMVATSLKCLSQINVELLVEIKKADRSSSLQFTEYPDDRFLSWLAHEIGHEWMMIGICLGFNFSFLERIEKDNTPTRANLTMLYAWRNEQDGNEDVGLKVLLHSLASVQRKDLITKINEDVQALLSTSPKQRVCRWVQKISSTDTKQTDDIIADEKPAEEEGLDDIDGLLPQQLKECDQRHDENLCISCLVDPEQAVSPLSEKFLVRLAGTLGTNLQLTLLQLGLPSADIDEIKRNVRDHTTAMFKCLLLAKRRYGEPLKFFADLMDGLKIQRDMQSVQTVRNLCRDWFESNRSSMDSQLRKLEQLMNRY